MFFVGEEEERIWRSGGMDWVECENDECGKRRNQNKKRMDNVDFAVKQIELEWIQLFERDKEDAGDWIMNW